MSITEREALNNSVFVLTELATTFEARMHELEARCDALNQACNLSVYALGMAIGEPGIPADTRVYLRMAVDSCRTAIANARGEA